MTRTVKPRLRLDKTTIRDLTAQLRDVRGGAKKSDPIVCTVSAYCTVC